MKEALKQEAVKCLHQDKPSEQRPEQIDTPLAGATDQELIAELASRMGLKNLAWIRTDDNHV